MAGGNIPSNLAPIFQQAGVQYHIPASVLAGIASVESNLGQNQGPSSAGAVGLMQFEPGTARSIGINPMDAKQAIFGAAKLLTQYGYRQDPFRAIGAYNGGPGNPQSGYARQVLSEAQRLGSQLAGGMQSGMPAVSGTGSPVQNGTAGRSTFDQAAFNRDNAKYIAGSFLAGSKNPFDIGPKGADLGSSSLVAPGLLTTKAPDPANYTIAQSTLQALAGPTVLNAHPAVQQQTGQTSNLAGGFLPHGATYVQGRRDQGRDGQTNPGGPLVAPGDGYVVRIGNDPHGFGPRYVIAHFTTGPYAGRTMYLGHALAAVGSGSFKAGSVLARTGTVPIGNATVPGWFEIGFADSGTPGPLGQAVPF